MLSLRTLALVVAGLVAIWLIVSVTAAGIFRTRSPDLALKLAPYDGGAKGAKAFWLLSRPDAAKGRIPAEARVLATEAVGREPTSVPAVRSLGLLASLANKPKEAERAFRYAEGLSRRDLSTQLWLIEWNVQQDDVPGALKHYDIALRTSPEASATLFPIMIAATAVPDVAVELRKLLLTRPAWGPMFVRDMVYGAKSPAVAASISRGLLDPTNPGERMLLSALMERLVQANSYNQAWQLYRSIRHPAGSGPLLRDGGFENDDPLPPFEWSMAQEPDLSSELRPRTDDSNKALYFTQTGGRTSIVTRQLLQLPPGSYVLSALVGDVQGDASRPPEIRVACVGGDAPLVVQRFPIVAGGERRLQAAFGVGGGCSAQWISVTVPGSLDAVESSGWIDDLSLRRAG